MMKIVLGTLVVLGLAATFVVLMTGVVSMFRGGAFNNRYANHLMRYRVGVQAATILFMLIYFLIYGI